MEVINLNLNYLLPAFLIALVFGAVVWFRHSRSINDGEPKKSSEIANPQAKISLLAKTQQVFTKKLDELILNSKQIDSSFFDALEELLYTGDLGPKAVEGLLIAVREKLSRNSLSDSNAVKKALHDEILIILGTNHSVRPSIKVPHVILVVGVNGVGKTTSIGKLAYYYQALQKKVLVVAGDTFRAAAQNQLSIWGERVGVDFYSSQTKDAAAVAFEGIQNGLGKGSEIIIVDTAGRLHTKENLMDELKKVKRVIEKALLGAPHEIILVIDATSGQNALIQARQFKEAIGVTSLIVTKLDGTARGGIIIGIAREVGLAVQFIGMGEKMTDLEEFSPGKFAKELLRI